jgi:hypothetical protein
MTRTPKAQLPIIFILLLLCAPAVFAQAAAPTPDAARDKTRERLTALLTRVGPTIKVDFQPSSKSPFVFTGVMREGLKNSESFEIVISVTTNETISFRIFPHFKGGYINIDKARNPTQLMRQLIQYNQKTFLFWGADDTGDVFTGYTFTLESGFPDEAIRIVLGSIKNSDQFIGEMRPSIDGSTAAP